MSQLPRYESYKDSGVQWLGEIPSHWVRTNVKYYYDIQLGKMLQPEAKNADDINIKYLKAQHVQWEKIDLENMPEMWCSSQESSKYMVKNGDLLICEGGEVGRCGILTNLEELAIIQNALHRVRNTTRADVRYLNYFIQHTAQSDWFSILCNKATIAHFTSEKLLALPTLIPPLEEQKIIADFLDKRLAQVDALIAKQETLLEKLAEQRVALISHAVTKGLNPDVKLQKSDSEILGSYPENWKVKRLRFDIETNPSKSEIQLDGSELVSFIPMESVSVGGGLDLSNERMISEVSSGYTYFADGDVVVAKITPCFENGKASIAENLHQGIAFGTTELHVLRCKENLLNKFLFFIIQSDKFMKYGESEMYGAGGQKRVPERFIKDYLIALPSLVEQKQICDFIESQLSHLDGLVQKVESTIATFKEYRSTLITQVVTGKIDVRNLKVN